jgi:hypothetical protein
LYPIQLKFIAITYFYCFFILAHCEKTLFAWEVSWVTLDCNIETITGELISKGTDIYVLLCDKLISCMDSRNYNNSDISPDSAQIHRHHIFLLFLHSCPLQKNLVCMRSIVDGLHTIRQ